MYFILSKLLLYLIFPLSWVFILSVAALIVKSKKRKLRLAIAALILLYLFSNTFLFNLFAKRWDIPAITLNDTTHYSCAVVLGGFSGEDKNGGGHFNGAADRFIQAVKLFKTGKVSHILITSGNGSLVASKFSEGVWVKTQLLALKIPDSAILIEGKSRNTIENARFSNVILKQSKLPAPYLLITSAFHMRRSNMIFKKERINVTPYSCHFLTNRNSYTFDDFVIPSAETLSNWSLYLKEIVGYTINYFNG